MEDDGSRHERHGAKQPERFDPAKASRLDDPERLVYLSPPRIAQLLQLESGILLDFGAGTGAYAIPLAQLLPNVTILALDEQPEMLDRLRVKLIATPLANVVPLSPEGLEPLGGHIDQVLAINVLHEIGDRDLAGIPALLRPEGRALFIDWNADVARPVGPPADHVYGVEEATKRLRSFGFAPQHVELFPYHYAIATQVTGTGGEPGADR